MPSWSKIAFVSVITVYQRSCWVTGYELRPCSCFISSPTLYLPTSLPPFVFFSTLSSCSTGLSYPGDRTKDNLAGEATSPEPHHKPKASVNIGPTSFASAQKAIQTQTTIRPPEQMRQVLLQRVHCAQSQTVVKNRIQNRPPRARRPSRRGLRRHRGG